jgi:hypothetical protein
VIVILHARRRSGRVEQHGTDQVASRVIQTTPIVKTVVGQHAKSVGRTSVADAARTLASTTNGRVGTPDEATSSIALHKHKQRNKAKDHLLERKGKEKKKKKSLCSSFILTAEHTTLPTLQFATKTSNTDCSNSGGKNEKQKKE